MFMVWSANIIFFLFRAFDAKIVITFINNPIEVCAQTPSLEH